MLVKLLVELNKQGAVNSHVFISILDYQNCKGVALKNRNCVQCTHKIATYSHLVASTYNVLN